MKVCVKTIYSSLDEIIFLKMHLMEVFDLIDEFIVCEFNYTHTGKKRDFSFDINAFDERFRFKIKYLAIDAESKIVKGCDEKLAHINEKYFRGDFVNHIELDPLDIIISVDADEIVFSHSLVNIIDKLKEKRLFGYACYALQMHQFFYKCSYLWNNLKFKSAVACQAGYYLNKEQPAQWRDVKTVFPGLVGAHFSWCIPLESMINKINNYAHSDQYKHLASKAILQKAIDDHEYPFDLNREFNIKEVAYEKNLHLFPSAFYFFIDDLEGRKLYG